MKQFAQVSAEKRIDKEEPHWPTDMEAYIHAREYLT